MSWTTPQDVQGSWIGDDTPDDTALLQKWIDRAERKIRREVLDISARLAVDPADPAFEPDLLDTVKDVVASMVERKFRNPEGVRSEQDGTGPLTGQRVFGGDQPGELWITPDELTSLAAAPHAGQRAFSIDLLPPPEEDLLAGASINTTDDSGSTA